MRIRPSSGVFWTSQPPQALKLASYTIPSRPVVGRPITVRYVVRNTGVVPSGPVSFEPLVPTALKVLSKRDPEIADIAPGKSATADFVVRAAAPTAARVETLAASRVGQDVSVLTIRVRRAASTASAGASSDTALLAIPAAGALLLAGVIAIRRRGVR